MTVPLPRSTPAAQGISPTAILEIIGQLNQEKMDVHSLMILRHGRVITEGWWSPCRRELPHVLFSLTKSFTSIAAGFAVQEGVFTVEDAAVSFFGDKLPCRPCAHMEEVRIKHLLTHTTGFDADPMCFKAPRDWPAHFVQTYLEHTPGTHFAYTDDGPNLVSAIIQRRTGLTLEEYLTPRLFEPLGITEWHWIKNADGINPGGSGLSLKTEDIAKFGLFMLQRGVWNGKRLLNEQWIQAAVSPLVDTPAQAGDWSRGYGYLFWQCVPPQVYRGDGAFGQFCVVLPQQDMVIAMTGGNNRGAEILALFWEKLLPAVRDCAVPADARAQLALEEALSGLALPVPSGGAEAGIASGVEYELSPNSLGLTHIRFDFGAATAVTVRAGEVCCTLPIGCGEWLEGRTFLRPDSIHTENPFCSLAACAGAWQGKTFHLAVQFPAAPFCYCLEIAFEGAPKLLGRWNVSFGPPSTDVIFARPV